ncbi:HigA family addiction module antitoxin [Arthrobacter sp. EPSL27]|uniref:HigA family addiction module antitoxin n=1 Tax=Arthrobacter sp. EPSL27 TaxID=1745378 RepID=UPI000A71B5E7|nr:HigA family addiction module antitoxin [Arthrobacter sp. EPSL27]
MSTELAEVFPAGEYLAEELEERGWTQAEFAEILGRPPQFVSEIISGKKEITRESAAQIGAALGTSAELWLKLQDSYFLWRQAQNEKTQGELNDVRLRARLKELAPVAVLRKRGLVTASSTRGQAEQIRQLFGLDSIYDEPSFLVAARRSNQVEDLSPTQKTWLACVYRKAESLSVAAYSKTGLTTLAQRLSQEVLLPSAFRDLPRLFGEVGVRLVFVEAFPSSKLDGASFLLDGSPVIAISGRGRRMDKVLFTLLHEIAHVVLGHVDDHMVLDDEDQHTLGEEEAADELAARWILPDDLPAPPDRISHGWVTSQAHSQGVHPVIVIGRLQKQGLLTWRSALIKGAPTIAEELHSWN